MHEHLETMHVSSHMALSKVSLFDFNVNLNTDITNTAIYKPVFAIERLIFKLPEKYKERFLYFKGMFFNFRQNYKLGSFIL